MAKGINQKDKEKQRELEKNWREIEKASDYLVKTSNPNLSWQELLGRGYETDHRFERVR
jgi:hypothetical protein